MKAHFAIIRPGLIWWDSAILEWISSSSIFYTAFDQINIDRTSVQM